MNYYEQEEGVEEGAATNQRHQEVVLSLGVLGGAEAMMEVTRTTADQEEMDSFVLVADKTGQTQATNHQETGNIHRSTN